MLRVVVPLIGKAHSDAVSVPGPELLDQPVVELFRTLSFQKRDDLRAPVGKLRAASPARVRRISQGHLFRIARVPSIFRKPDLLNCCLASEWWKRRSRRSHIDSVVNY